MAQTSAGIAAAPYMATVGARVCTCVSPTKELGRSRDLPRAITRIAGYWNVYLAFYGDQIVWLNFDVIDLRDGTVVWRNGRHTNKEDGQLDHKQSQDEDGRTGRGTGTLGGADNRR